MKSFLFTSRFRALGLMLSALAILIAGAGCENEKAITIGFVGGLTGRVADMGIAGRDGTQLAIEQANARGGVNGRTLQLLVRDDRQERSAARKAVEDLVARNCAVIIGHMTSEMSLEGAAVAQRAKTVMISPTTSTDRLSGRDDYFFRLYPSIQAVATRLAAHAAKELGYREVTVVYDRGNAAYTRCFLRCFRDELARQGGAVAARPFISGDDFSFYELAENIAASGGDALLILANAMDTAMLCQQLRKIRSNLPILASEWSMTEEILAFGGKAVEGVTFLHSFDPGHRQPQYLQFRRDFRERFGYDPDFAALHAYDATRLALAALNRNPDPRELHDTLLTMGSFAGTQCLYRFDEFGDVDRDFHLLTIRDGSFQPAAGEGT